MTNLSATTEIDLLKIEEIATKIGISPKEALQAYLQITDVAKPLTVIKDKLPPKKILLDADGTLFYNDYPLVGEENDHCARVLKRLLNQGHEFILYTMREGHLVDDVLSWLKARDIEVKYVMCNPEFETGSRKIFGNLTIDDHGLGIPLIRDTTIHSKPFVDWLKCEKLLEEIGYL